MKEKDILKLTNEEKIDNLFHHILIYDELCNLLLEYIVLLENSFSSGYLINHLDEVEKEFNKRGRSAVLAKNRILKKINEYFNSEGE